MSVAIVTGAAGAIGAAVAARLAAGGDAVLCVDRSDHVVATSRRIEAEGGRAEALMVDLGEVEAPRSILDAAANLGEISLLVNNAGITRDARALKMSEADFRAVIGVNAVAPLRLVDAIAPRMADGGAVVNVSSRAALGNFGQANYVTAKSALIGATRALALRLAPRLRVNAVAPGLVATPMTEAMPADVLAKLISKVPAGRVARPEEIADAIAFLAASSYVTGQTLMVCGGRSVGDALN
jgi:3-oxoacyl-[acyl-carrier protein] reductase